MAKRLVAVAVALLSAVAIASAEGPTPENPLSGGTTASVAMTDASALAPAPMQIPPGAKLYIEPSGFGMALSAAILKKKVPVVAVMDSSKADFFAHTTSNETREKGGERVAKVLMFGGFAGSGNTFHASVTVTNRDGVIVFAHNSKKENFQSAAQNIAGQLKNSIEKQ